MLYDGSNIKLSDDPEYNYIQIDNEDFYLSYLNPNKPFNKGASSNVFILHDPNQEIEDRVIKICKIPYRKNSRNKFLRRFVREIDAFRIAMKHKCKKVIKFYKSGQLEIDEKIFLFLILEKADSDLATFMEENKFAISIGQKLSICIGILQGIQELHKARIYHRDIKHDNILYVAGEFKIGDLGLADFQNADFQMDEVNEKIGPTGWLSPEATNKMLTEQKPLLYTYDCVINYKSDIFQLGKLFWYVFQANLPVGQILYNDCRFQEEDLFDIFFAMLQYNKITRPEIDQIFASFAPIQIRLAV